MGKRRRWLLGVLSGLLLILSLKFWLGSQTGNADVRLVLLGLTNYWVATNIPSRSGTIVGTLESKATFLITNAGTCSVNLEDRPYFSNVRTRTRFMLPQPSGLPAALHPKRSLVVQVNCLHSDEPWQAHVNYSLGGPFDRISRAVWNSTNTLLRKFGRKLIDKPSLHWTQSDWLINAPLPDFFPQPDYAIRGAIPQPRGNRLLLPSGLDSRPGGNVNPYGSDMAFPGASGRRYHITAPPPPETYDLRNDSR
jgi:hypothetical protein